MGLYSDLCDLGKVTTKNVVGAQEARWAGVRSFNSLWEQRSHRLWEQRSNRTIGTEWYPIVLPQELNILREMAAEAASAAEKAAAFESHPWNNQGMYSSDIEDIVGAAGFIARQHLRLAEHIRLLGGESEEELVVEAVRLHHRVSSAERCAEKERNAQFARNSREFWAAVQKEEGRRKTAT